MEMPFRTDLDVRDFRFVTSEPEKIGGNNEGPTPMEYVLGALNGCLGVVVELVAKEQGIPLRDLKNIEFRPGRSARTVRDRRRIAAVSVGRRGGHCCDRCVFRQTFCLAAASAEALPGLQPDPGQQGAHRHHLDHRVGLVTMNTYGHWVVGLAVAYTILLVVAGRIARRKAEAGTGGYFVGGRQFSRCWWRAASPACFPVSNANEAKPYCCR